MNIDRQRSLSAPQIWVFRGREAFAEIVDDFMPTVLGAAFGLCGDWDLAGDIAQLDEVEIGMPVEVVVHDTGEGRALYRFPPARA